jgi:biofilm PGA synthesis N-glycosyltransferase PgaC
MKKFNVSVGVIAHNEEKNINQILVDLLNQNNSISNIVEIIVVSSGSTDLTNEIVEKFPHEKIRLIKQKYRMGKASAVNKFIQQSKCELLILTSADLSIAKNTIDELLKPFQNTNIGMTGAHPIPINNHKTIWDFLTNLSWHLHHENNKKHVEKPKLGEMIAFKKIFPQIPAKTAVDEADIQAIMSAKNQRQIYCPNAIIYNKGPTNFKDYLKQRLRINIGHMGLLKRTGYHVTTYSLFGKIWSALGYIGLNPKLFFWAFLGFLLENFIRLYAFLLFRFFKKNPYIWDISHSTKFSLNHYNESKNLLYLEGG